jgi:hypothetical protein
VGGIALGVSLAVGLLLGASLVGSPADEQEPTRGPASNRCAISTDAAFIAGYSLGVSLAPVYSGPVEKPHLDPD